MLKKMKIFLDIYIYVDNNVDMKTLSGKIFDSIRAKILDFTYSPGVRLSDDEIAAEYKMSRTPVREALNRLAELGLVEAKSNRGFRVKTFSKKDIEDLYVLRNTLECLAVKLTTERMNSSIEKKLKDILKSYPSIIRSDDIVKFSFVDSKYHNMIASFSGNLALYETLNHLSFKIHVIRRYDHLRPGSLERTYEQHLQILNYMLSHDIKKAQKSMAKHISNSMNILLKMK